MICFVSALKYGLFTISSESAGSLEDASEFQLARLNVVETFASEFYINQKSIKNYRTGCTIFDNSIGIILFSSNGFFSRISEIFYESLSTLNFILTGCCLGGKVAGRINHLNHH